MNSIGENLPDVLQQIVDIAGVGAALNLAKSCGGCRINIPKKVEGSYLAQTVGLDAAKKIVKELGHGQILIPMGPWRGERARREALRRSFESGATAKDAAYAADVSERTAWRLKATLGKSCPHTLPLFSKQKSQS